MNDNVDFNFIITSGIRHGLTVDQSLFLALLLGLVKNAPMEFHPNTQARLLSAGYVKEEEGVTSATKSALAIFRKQKRNNAELAHKLRQIYPPGMKDDKWPWRGTTVSVADKLDAFNKKYPDITDEEIIQATKDYLERFTEESGRSLLVYFINKQIAGQGDKSILADYVYMTRENSQSKNKSNYEQI